MSQFNAITIAAQVAKHPHIGQKRGMFGFGQHVVYQLTSSRVDSYINYYDATSIELLKRVMESKDEELPQLIGKSTEIECNANGPYRLELCISRDRKFIAMAIAKANGHDLSPIRYFEGNTAELVEALFA